MQHPPCSRMPARSATKHTVLQNIQPEVCAGAKIGVPSLHKAKRREEKQEQELIDTGMKSLRGRGKRKAASQKGRKEKGLNEAQGFKAGVMRVKPNAMKAGGIKKQGQKQKLGKSRGKKRK